MHGSAKRCKNPQAVWLSGFFIVQRDASRDFIRFVINFHLVKDQTVLLRLGTDHIDRRFFGRFFQVVLSAIALFDYRETLALASFSMRSAEFFSLVDEFYGSKPSIQACGSFSNSFMADATK
ncbi:hypothetical protein [Methylomonas lenta]|uniref:hypothetical protein n=1 Tax=Methylomonas lenta TaxID=980561 RepID=UPI0012F6B4CE|nr:hypothetical protein [Methylomonas lenta]